MRAHQIQNSNGINQVEILLVVFELGVVSNTWYILIKPIFVSN